MERRLRSLALKYPVITEVRGAGVMWGLQLAVDALPYVDLARERGVLVNRTDEKVIRLLPALNVAVADLDPAMDVLDAVFATVGAGVPA
mgnify:FL=1